MYRAFPSIALLTALLFVFSQSAPTVGAQEIALAQYSNSNPHSNPHSNAHSKIKYVIIIVQENRTPDNLFQGLPGADIVNGELTTAQLAHAPTNEPADDDF
jgi:phospholipase C